jgi:hypothetical protein
MVLISITLAFLGCNQTTNSDLEKSLQNVQEATLIEGAQNETMKLQHGDSQDSFFKVTLNDGLVKEGWCIEWNEQSVNGLQDGVKLYSTKGHQSWDKINYFMSIKDDLRASDPEFTFREIQVVIWSLIDSPSFDVEKISEYKDISPRIYKDGEPLFNVQKVKSVVAQVQNHLSSVKNKINAEEHGVILIENEGQTIMIGNETAFAVKTNPTAGENVVDSDYSTCFSQEIIENVSFNRWGWTNGPISDPSGELTFDIYAGAGQCDLNKGVRVGELTVNYLNGTFTATYKMTETSEFTGNLYTLIETHLYVGNDPYPRNQDSGKFTVAPGQYENQNNHGNITEYTYEINDVSGDVYFIGHAVVNGFEPDND